jgi:3-oxoacid CoA-transferase subunit A
VVASAVLGVDDVSGGATIVVEGFALGGVPNVFIGAPIVRGVGGLGVVSNAAGRWNAGLAALLAAGRIMRATNSYIGGHK